ncbi:hypothetical protein P154DRAFT_453882 [Amniculicola lignicola CBS 123094]|uniref:RNA recognition motif-containing protein n=1 Tax=Amniculicola lignicola CBS 123094 TaxID=1392246 RepID=A0A6A5X310_9PLEO|nr:hypothetical protein P154DRAFT_453882 [Amniculicola lignicola CBS 123094]
MPPQQGEVSLATLFADIHYYLGPPTSKPPHHRFDKGSYVYVYHSPMQQKGRIEIANYAGTPDQDAFSGYLDTVKIQQTYKHPCMFTITVDSFRSQGGSGAPSPQQDMSQWHLPAHDLRNEGKYLYRLHTLDIYFWTPEDATMFLDSMKRVVQPHQLEITANPSPLHAEHKTDVMNPLVAKLEKAAVSHTSRSPSISTTQSFPGPPTAPAPTASPAASGNYAPIAYNPAAPAAPEPIAHREKTPPPPDAADGTGLGTAAANDHAPQYASPFQATFAPQSTAGPYMPGPPSRTQTFSGPPTPGIQRTNTAGTLPPPPAQSPPQGQAYPQQFAPPPSAPPPGQYDANGTPTPGLQRHSTMPVQQYANQPPTPGYAPLQSPGMPGTPGHAAMASPGYAPQNYQPLASPPPGGYSTFQYGSTSQQNPPDPYNPQQQQQQQQTYRPTEQESTVNHNEPAPPPRNSNIGKKAEKVEKGVGRFLKKLDKKF